MKKHLLIIAFIVAMFAVEAQTAGSMRDCDITTLPYFENFDGFPEESYPPCWTKPNPFQGYPMTEGGYSHSGSYALKFKCNYNNSEPLYAVMPHINANFNDLQLTFWTRPEGQWSYNFQVGYMTSQTDTSTFVELLTLTGSSFGSPVSYQQHIVSFDSVPTTAGNDYYIAFRYKDSGNNWYWFVDDIQVDAVAGCNAPTDLSVGQVTSTSATLFWDGDNDLYYSLYYREDGDSLWSIMTGLPNDTTGNLLDYLTPNTTYQWYVATECSDGSLANSAGISSFTTPCAVYPAPFFENFDSLPGLPECWGLFDGLASGVFADSATLTIHTSPYFGWDFSNTNIFGIRHASLNIYGINTRYWLVTPEIDLSTLNNPTLTFDLALTDWNNTDPIENPNGQPDDKFMVIISTDGGTTWSANNAILWSNDSSADHSFNQIATQGEEITIPLAAYANQTVRIAFYGESTTGNGDNDLHLDNVKVDEMASCAKPTQLSISNTTSSSVDLSWTEMGNATSWIVEYGVEGFTLGNGDTINVNSSASVHIDGLLSGTAYDVYVIANCGDGNLSNAATTSFTTSMAATDLPYSTDFSGTANQDWLLNNGNCLNHWVIGTLSNTESALFVTNNGTTPGYNIESTAVVCAEKTFTVGNDTAFSISFDARVGGEFEYDYLKVFFAPADVEFPASVSGNVAYASNTYSAYAVNFSEYQTSNSGTTFPYTFCETEDNTVHIDAVMPNPNPNATSTATAKLVFVWKNDNMIGAQPAAIISNVSVSALTCPKPTSLTASNITETSADLTWVAGGEETAWNLEYKAENESDWTVFSSYSNYATLTGLTDSTTYLVRVQADCGNDDVSTYTTLTFTTGSATTPVITNPTVSTGLVSNITQTTATITGTITNPDNVTITEKGFELTTVSSGNQATFTVAGSGNTFSSDLTNLTPETDYAYRAFITFNEQTIFGTTVTFTTLPDETPEPCDAPTGLVATEVTHESITVAWDSSAALAWGLDYSEPNVTTVTSIVGITTNSCTITGLQPETPYTIWVMAFCEDGVTSDYSAPLNVTTQPNGINNYLLNSISLYPNPAKDVVNVQCTMNNVQIESIEVFDVYGKLLQTVSMTPETTTINVSGFAAGMYFVRVTTEQGVATKSFVKK